MLFQEAVFLMIRRIACVLRTMPCPIFLPNKLLDVEWKTVLMIARKGGLRDVIYRFDTSLSSKT